MIGYKEINNDKIMRSLIKFDTSSIPSGSTIYSATLSLNLAGYTNVDNLMPISISRISESWDENVTWNKYQNLNILSDNTTSIQVGQNLDSYITWDVTQMFQSWFTILNRENSFAVTLNGVEDQGFRLRGFWSKDCSDNDCHGNYPKLEIRYSLPDNPSEPSPTITPTPTVTPLIPVPIFKEAQDITFPEPSKTLYYPLVVRNWPSTNLGQTQWSHLLLTNPSNEKATATITVRSAYTDNIKMGETLKSFSLVIPAFGSSSLYDNEDWKNLPDNWTGREGVQTLGAVTVESTVPLVGVNRWQLRTGAERNGPITDLHETPLMTTPSTELDYPLIMKNWPQVGGSIQSSDLILYNPRDSETELSIKLYDASENTNGSLLREIKTSIPGYGWLNTGALQEWQNLPSTDGQGTMATVKVSTLTDRGIVGIVRWKSMTNTQKPFILSQTDTPLLTPSSMLYYPLILRNWFHHAGSSTQWSDLLLYNPSEKEDARVSIELRDPNAANNTLPVTISVTIPKNGYYSTFGKDEWSKLPDTHSNSGVQTYMHAAIKVLGRGSVVGVNRWRLIPGNEYTGVPQHISDTPLITNNQITSYTSPLTLRGVSTGMENTKVWSDLILVNQTAQEQKVIFTTYAGKDTLAFENGMRMSVFIEKIPAYGLLNTYDVAQWHALPQNNSDPASTQGSTHISFNENIYGVQRLRYSAEPPPNACPKKSQGDADCNNAITNNDYVIWLSEFTASKITTISDFNQNGDVDNSDFEIWRRTRFGSANQ